MGGEEGKKRGKKKFFLLVLGAIGALTAIAKKKKQGQDEAGWEEATPGS
jgi:hypothetical protein